MKSLFLLLLTCCAPLLGAQSSLTESILKENWCAFVSTHSKLDHYDSFQIAILANGWGRKMTEDLSVSADVRDVDPATIEQLLCLLKQDGAKIYMRHGAQVKSERVWQLPPPEQKIEMMRLPDNMENSISDESFCELLEMMIVWKYLQQKTDSCFLVESSENRRAFFAADALSWALGTEVQLNPSLTCVNYPPNEVMSTEEILQLLPDGALPWEKEKVDRIIGPGTYQRITDTMQNKMDAETCENTVVLDVTHTQQLNAVAVLSDLPPIRLGNFGFLLLTDKQKALFSDGIFTES